MGIIMYIQGMLTTKKKSTPINMYYIIYKAGNTEKVLRTIEFDSSHMFVWCISDTTSDEVQT